MQRLDVGFGGSHVTVLDMPFIEGRATDSAVLPRHTLVGAPGAPVVAVLGGISATRHVVSTREHDGWWNDVAGKDRAIDTRLLRVLGIDFLDGGRDHTGRPARVVTTHDQARALRGILELHQIGGLHGIIGSSYGGMVALAFAELFPHLIEQIVVISAAHESHAMSTALRTLQRRTVELGLDTGRVDDAMSIARGLAMTTYRTADEFAQRFGAGPLDVGVSDARFAVDDYLKNRGARFARTMRPERFLALSLSGDLHRVDPARITTPTTLVAAEGDAIVPREQIVTLTAALAGPANLVDLTTAVGHDAFLVESARVSAIIAAELSAKSCTPLS